MATSNLENPMCHIFCRQEGDKFVSGYLVHSAALVRLVIFFGAVSVLSGVWECTQAIEPYYLVGDCAQYEIAGKILLFTGSLLIVMSLVAIMVVGRLMRIAIFSLLHGLSLVLLLESVAGSLAFAMAASVSNGFLNRCLLRDLEWEYSVDQRVTYTWDEIQKAFHCCGINGPKDWENSFWFGNRTDDADKYPSSCCHEKFEMCDNSTVNEKGCGKKASAVLLRHQRWTYVCAFSCILIHLTCYLALSLLEKRA